MFSSDVRDKNRCRNNDGNDAITLLGVQKGFSTGSSPSTGFDRSHWVSYDTNATIVEIRTLTSRRNRNSNLSRRRRSHETTKYEIFSRAFSVRVVSVVHVRSTTLPVTPSAYCPRTVRKTFSSSRQMARAEISSRDTDRAQHASAQIPHQGPSSRPGPGIARARHDAFSGHGGVASGTRRVYTWHPLPPLSNYRNQTEDLCGDPRFTRNFLNRGCFEHTIVLLKKLFKLNIVGTIQDHFYSLFITKKLKIYRLLMFTGFRNKLVLL